jgi:N-acyl-D-aspartate/D-glutamate deacylase
MLLGFETSVNPFSLCPSYARLADLPFDERIKALRDPDVRAQLLTEDSPDAVTSLKQLNRRFEFMYPLGDPPNYEPAPETSIAVQAAARGIDPLDVAYDLMLENGGRAMLLLAITNYGNRCLDPVLTMMNDPNSVLGLGDGGAHYPMICDSSFTTFLLQHWTRDRKGEQLAIEQAVRMLTSAAAEAVELRDRGILSVGRKADINVIDYESLRLEAPQVFYDLPAGGRRLDQRARGYDATIVAGQVVMRDGNPTGALPGRLVRGPQAAPS